MKRLARVLMTGVFAAASLRCGAEACTEVAVQGRVEASRGELTLADLLARGTCFELRKVAAQVNLGAVPRAASVRVLDGRQIRRLLEGLEGGGLSPKKTVSVRIPERIVVRRAGATKSCAEIARFLASAAPSQDMATSPSRGPEDLDCAAARGITEDTPLELTKTAWNAALQRWEFALRCARFEDCVPFLVWAHKEKTPPPRVAKAEAPRASGNGAERLVKPGQTATLTWDRAGIRIVLPVTCLDAGALGQFVRVRFNNAPRILRAEVVGEGTLRASL